MIRCDKKRIAISVDEKTLELLEYNAESMGITKSELIARYMRMIGRAGEKREMLFMKHFNIHKEI